MELKLSAAAESDLAEARDWHDMQRPGLGDEFLLSVRARLEVMAERPLQFPLLESESGRHFRFALIRRFP